MGLPQSRFFTLFTLLLLILAGCGTTDSGNDDQDDDQDPIEEPTPTPTEEGLIGYWAFDGDAMDQSGNGNHGTVNGGAALAADRLGRADRAYSFDGADGYIDMGNSQILKPDFPITITAWFNITGSKSGILSTNFNETAYHGIFMSYNSDNDYLTFSFGSGGGINSDHRTTVAYPSPVLGEWVHFAGTIDASGVLEMYINGNQVTVEESGTGGDMAYDDGPFNIGRVDSDPFGPPTYYEGMIDELRIYNRVLSDSEIEVISNYEGD